MHLWRTPQTRPSTCCRQRHPCPPAQTRRPGGHACRSPPRSRSRGTPPVGEGDREGLHRFAAAGGEEGEKEKSGVVNTLVWNGTVQLSTHLGILVECLHVGVCGRGVEVVVALLGVLPVVPLAACQAEDPLLQKNCIPLFLTSCTGKQ